MASHSDNKYIVNKKLDYISCSVTNFMVADDAFGQWKDTHARQRNYNKAKKFDNGLIVQWHDSRPEMKINLTLSGECLDNMRYIGMTDYGILHWMRNMPSCKFSRIDIAITSAREDGSLHGFLPHAIHYLAQNGLCNTKLGIDKPVANQELEVETAYIGSRKSRNRLFRAYDKGIDIGETARRLIRYELQTNKNASHIASEIAEKQTDYGAIMRRYVDFPEVEDWVEIMGAEVSENFRVDDSRPAYIREREANNARLQWLMNSVAPAFAKVLEYESLHSTNPNRDTEIREWFDNMVEYHRSRLGD